MSPFALTLAGWLVLAVILTAHAIYEFATAEEHEEWD